MLLSSARPLSGQHNADSNSYCLEQTLTVPDFVNLPATTVEGLYITRAPHQAALYEIGIPILENKEDEDLVSFKRHLKSCSLPILFLTRVPGHSFSCGKESTPVYGGTPFTPSPGSIGLQVFRI